jgi:hypothetical protein
MRYRLAAMAIVAGAGFAEALAAQAIRGTVVDAAGARVPGVVVLLVSAANANVARDLTDEAGQFQIAAPVAGEYRIRTLRIGFRQTLTAAFTLAVGQELTRQVDVESVAFSLDTVRVMGRNQCRVASDSAAATFAVWEQARAALTAASVTARSRANRSAVVTYERVMDPDRRRVREQTVSIQGSMSHRAWRARVPDSLRRFGYVSVAQDGWMTYYAPDLEVLLSDEFLEDHCFRLATTRDVGVLGIAFEPTRQRSRIPEITGTLWFDRKTDELRSLEFKYTNLDQRQIEDAAGGDLAFARLANGAWVITRWNIRMPVLASRSTAAIPGSSGAAQIIVTALRVTGGELAYVMRGRDTIWSRPPLVIAGTVVDSMSGSPIAGARVAIGGSRSAVTTDARGRFEISTLPGEYVIETRTPSLDSVAFVHSSPVTIADAPLNVTVRAPSAMQVLGKMCGAGLSQELGLVTGTVTLQGDSTPPRNMTVVAEWQDLAVRNDGGPRALRIARHTQGRTDARGAFRLCGVPLSTAAALRPVVAGDSAAATLVRIPDGARYIRVDLTVEPERRP